MKFSLPWLNKRKKKQDDGLSSKQVKTLMAHIGTLTSICIVKPLSDCSSEEKKKLRDSIKQREHICYNKLNRYTRIEDYNSEDGNNNNTNKNKGFNRFSNILEATPNILEYKDVLRRLSTQMFVRNERTMSIRRGKRFSIVPPLAAPMVFDQQEFFAGEDDDEEDGRTTNFVLTQRFIGWKV